MDKHISCDHFGFRKGKSTVDADVLRNDEWLSRDWKTRHILGIQLC